MLVRTLASHYRLITQNDHAHWAYQLLSVWPTLAQNPRRQTILEATRQHDRGWQGIDSSPLVQSSGKPHDFRSLPIASREAVWRDAIWYPDDTEPQNTTPSSTSSLARAWRELLICHHAWTIHQPHRTLPSCSNSIPGTSPPKQTLLPLLTTLGNHRKLLLDEFSRLLEDFESKAEPAGDRQWPTQHEIEDTLDDDYRWLSTLDNLSLIVSNAWTGSFPMPHPDREPPPSSINKSGSKPLLQAEELTAHFDGEALSLSPFPLRGNYSLPLRSRDIPIQNYRTNSALSVVLARSTWHSVEIKVLRGN